MFDKNCQKCFGTGERHNGYYSYPCDCMNTSSYSLNKDRQEKKLISKEKYILDRIINYVDYNINENIDASLIKWLIDQWSFDYDMNKEYYPESLINK